MSLFIAKVKLYSLLVFILVGYYLLKLLVSLFLYC